jgi:hypothetical protein
MNNEAFKHSPYKQVHIKNWACMAEAKAYYLMQGFKTIETWEDYDIMQKGFYEVMVSRKSFLNVKSSLIIVKDKAFKQYLNKARIQSIRFFLSTMTETKSYI